MGQFVEAGDATCYLTYQGDSVNQGVLYDLLGEVLGEGDAIGECQIDTATGDE